ncbi:MAG: ATP-dependent zinc protease [Planctomycetaceae bacterium]|nr:ATP-dependent zinc protease [Planctomycetaceae bacterium]
MTTSEPERLPVIGWREWCVLPDLGVPGVKAKIDTGARSSCLHAFDVETVRRRGQRFVRFKVHPLQRNDGYMIAAEAEVLEIRSIRSSNGEVTDRPVIVTHVELMGERWPIELTLANRDAMGFRMLLGREALRRRFLVEPGRSYLAGKRPRAVYTADGPVP